MSTVWFIAEDVDSLASLRKMADIGASTAAVLAIGDESLCKAASHGAELVKWIDPLDNKAECLADAAFEAVFAADVAGIVAVATPAARTVAGIAATKTGCAIASNVVKVAASADGFRITRCICDDSIVEESVATGMVFALVNPLSVQTGLPNPTGDTCAVEKIDAKGDAFIEKISLSAAETTAVESAERVVGVGMGVASDELIEQARRFASTIGAEIGGTMNIVDHTDYFEGERYIGLSGIRIAPKLYFALGVGGAPQHLAGIRNAKTIAVVNSDPKANFFNHADYGIVGDAADIIPALLRALG